MTDNRMTPERIAEIKDLLKYESSIAFYSHRAKESILLLVAEAEEAARLRKQAAIVETFVADRADYITAIRNCHPNNGHDYNRWQGHAESRRQLAEQLGLPVAWPAEEAAAPQHYDKVPDPVDGCHWCACGNRWPCKDAKAVTA
ncbi:hypothetical protein [Streptomyces sp. NPDC088794]|uniref:hypothetical protein n=1 Tax=Streptomyces sp. NPDC088794 TaxID=3365902 RepID=UPI0037F9A630